ncbi:MFS transporter [Phenylobacterium sp. 58.2.17]|uniref:MFS transporter n=1 Tax=Phenylobacterium sp. 58.2.17 TaxID=2969306 RepID=UPI002263BD43|nr:MFS transporter [Phenylobacterium sp. 58.2.17]MCX7587477.1 MFS transporter [Phenylobacterium sp. 58.2.17]
MTQSTIDTPQQHLAAGTTLFLALAAAVATSTSYTVQPELGVIAADLGASLASTSAAAGLPIVGYLLGLALLVPLVDRVRPHKLVSAQLAALAGALGLAAVATSVFVFGAGLLLSGICASTGAQMSTLAAKHSPADRQGRALGVVTAGISAGILLGRMLGGGLTDLVGWRAMLLLVAAACLACAGVGRAVLPRGVIRAPGSWLSGLLSTPGLLRARPDLLGAAVAGGLWFFAFSLIWVGVSLALSLPPHGLSPTVVGLYSLAGIAGMLVTPAAGRMADRFGSRPIVLAGLLTALVCTVAMWPALGSAPLLLAALALFDAGLFAAQVANQRRVLSMDPLRPAQMNSTYMVIYFVGGSLGAAAGGPIVSLLGWPAAVIAAALAILAALALAIRQGGAALARPVQAKT